MIERLEIDGLVYEISTDNHNTIYVALVGGSNPSLQSIVYDPFDRPEEWSREPYRMEDINGVRKPVLVQRQVLRAVKNWIRREAPYYFRYKISAPRRFTLYTRIAHRLAREHGYSFHYFDDGSFHFYRNTAV